eukprot:2391201-Alexandrium_andersonii.AAC.1
MTAENCIMLKWKDKKGCFSMASKAACRSSGAAPEGAQSLHRTNDTIEPLYYHALPRLFWED